MTRTPEEVFQHHAQALGAGDLDEIVADYADDAFLITPAGINRGKDGVRAAFVQLLADVPDAAWDLKTQLYEGDVLFLEWAADAAHSGRGRYRHVRVPRRPDPGADGPLHAAAQGLTDHRPRLRLHRHRPHRPHRQLNQNGGVRGVDDRVFGYSLLRAAIWYSSGSR